MRVRTAVTIAALLTCALVTGCSTDTTASTKEPTAAAEEPRPPIANFSFYYDDANQTLVVRHATGESVKTGRLTIYARPSVHP